MEHVWECTKTRGGMLSLSIFQQKNHLQESRPLIRECMSKLDLERTCITRSKGGYIPFKCKSNNFKKNLFPNTTKIWNSLSKNIQFNEHDEFKGCIKKDKKPPKYKHFARGSKFSNTLLTRIRAGRSSLNQHKFTIGLSDSPECI